MPPHGNDYKQSMCSFAPPQQRGGTTSTGSTRSRAQSEQQSTGSNINVGTETDTIEITATSPIRSILKTSTSRSPSPRSSANMKSFQVQFDSLEIRTFPQVLGDHPCCSKGLPISLGWTHTSQHTISLDVYESERIPVESRRHMRLDEFRRWEILKNACANEEQTSSISQSESESENNSASAVSGIQDHCHAAAASTVPPLPAVSSCKTELSSTSCPGAIRRSCTINDVDGKEIATASVDAMYSEAELKRAERRMSRERDRMRKRKAVQRFFDTPIYAE